MLTRPAVDRTAHCRKVRDDARPVLWLHIGAPKTGTTALQVALEANTGSLLEAGWLYTKAGRFGPAHHRLPSAVRVWRDRDLRSRPCFDQLRTEIERTGAPRIFVSSENFFLDIDVEALARHLEPFDVHVLAYIRGQENWLRSYFAQFVKHERYRFYDAEHDDNYVLNWLGELADYFDRLQAFAQVFGQDRLTVRDYDEPSIKHDVIGDVCVIVGIDPASIDSKRKERNARTAHTDLVAGGSNVSINDDELEIVRLSNSFGLPAAERDRWLYELQEVALLRRALDRSRATRFTLGLKSGGNREKLKALRARNTALLSAYSADRYGLANLAIEPPAKPGVLDLSFAPGRLKLNTLVEVTAALAVRRSELNTNLFTASKAAVAGRPKGKWASLFRPRIARSFSAVRQAGSRFRWVVQRSRLLSCLLPNFGNSAPSKDAEVSNNTDSTNPSQESEASERE